MAVATSQMTFNDPNTIVGLMDAISDGWRYGRATEKLDTHRWEDSLERPIADLRAEFGVTASQIAAEQEARRIEAAA